MSELKITDTAGAAEILGVSVSRVKQLDDVLQPAIIGRSKRRLRVYSVPALEAYAAQRDALKDQR